MAHLFRHLPPFVSARRLGSGVIVVANIPARTGAELEAQIGQGVRYVRVVRVIQGDEPNEKITAEGESDPALRMDVDLLLHLRRTSDGVYHLDHVERAR